MSNFISSVVQSDALFREETRLGRYIPRCSKKCEHFMLQKRLKVRIGLSVIADEIENRPQTANLGR